MKKGRHFRRKAYAVCLLEENYLEGAFFGKVRPLMRQRVQSYWEVENKLELLQKIACCKMLLETLQSGNDTPKSGPLPIL